MATVAQPVRARPLWIVLLPSLGRSPSAAAGTSDSAVEPLVDGQDPSAIT